jgi:hypothetical protein
MNPAMVLVIKQKDFEDIQTYLFKENKEGMILGCCKREAPCMYSLNEIFFPEKKDYKKRSQSIVTLKAESAYPLLRKLKDNHAFLQAHNHLGKKMLFFSLIDNSNNRFNVEDIRGFNQKADFFRIVFTKEKSLSQYYDYKKKRFKPLKLKIGKSE